MTNYDPLVHPNQSTRSSAQTLMKTTNMDSQSSENWHLSSPVNKVMTSFLRKVRLFNEKRPAGNKRGFSCSISCVPTTGHSEITSLPAAIRRMIWVGQII